MLACYLFLTLRWLLSSLGAVKINHIISLLELLSVVLHNRMFSADYITNLYGVTYPFHSEIVRYSLKLIDGIPSMTILENQSPMWGKIKPLRAKTTCLRIRRGSFKEQFYEANTLPLAEPWWLSWLERYLH